ncbi:MAG TPA: VCBS repeat-containing protein [Polyangiaceae bacterium]|nr:VCBS repeat-containing protein [Polyangiaceae bacterium]
MRTGPGHDHDHDAARASTRAAAGVARVVASALALVPCACQRPASAPPPPPPPAAIAGGAPAQAPPAPVVTPPAAWPAALADVLRDRGQPHAQPLALPPDERGRSRWLAFVGPPDVALGAWHVSLGAEGGAELAPVEHWPTGVRVVGGVVEAGVAYVLLESVGVLDQPAGLRAAWIDSLTAPSPFESAPMALSDVRSAGELAERVKRAPLEGDAPGLLAALRAASASPSALGASVGAEGADVQIAWQGLFTQRMGHLDADTAAASPLAGAVLNVLREAASTQACGADACEAWTDAGRAVVRFARLDGRWLVRSVTQDAPTARASAAPSPARQVTASPEASETEALLRARARRVERALGQAPLTASGGTIGVAHTDLTADAPVVVVREGAAVRVFELDAGGARAEGGEARWEAAFADVDGDGRTDVVVHMSAPGSGGGLPVAWTQAFLAPPPSVQATRLEPDLASALATMDAPDAAAASRAAVAVPMGRVSRDAACRLLATAGTPLGFRRQAAADARLLHFDEPGMPTWRPKVVSLARLAVDDVRGIGDHCTELVCSATRPYCAWAAGADSEHFWFDWREGRLQIIGAADYDGE